MKDGIMYHRYLGIDIDNNIKLNYCGKMSENETRISGPETKDHYLMVLIDHGKAEMCDDNKLQFSDHDLLIVCPDTKVHYQTLIPWTTCWIGLRGDTVKTYMDLLGVSPQNPILHIPLYGELKSVMDRIFDASNNLSFSSRLHICGLIYEFFSVLVKNSTIDTRPDPVDSFLGIVEYNYCENISVSQIAKNLNIDPAYLSRKFTEKMGISPKKYILKKRIERAQNLLTNTKESILEIANSVGYEDQFLFSRIFKQSVGLSPSEYRKQR